MRLVVGKTAIRANDRARDFILLNFRLIIHFEDDGICQFFLVGTERADAIAEPFGQHWHGTIDQIDRCGAIVCLLIDDVALFHIVRNVGNVNAHFPQTIVEATNGERIVKIFCIGRVDGECADLAHIDAASNLFRSDTSIDFFGSGFRLCRIFVRQSKFCQNGMHFGLVIAHFAKHFHYFADRIFGFVAPLHNTPDALLTIFCAMQFVERNKQVVNQLFAIDIQESNRRFHLQNAHKRALSALQNLNHFAFRLAIFAARIEHHLHMVAIECATHATFRHKHRFATIVGNEIGLFGHRLAVENARNITLSHIDAISSSRNLRNGALSTQFVERSSNLATLLGRIHVERMSQLLVVLRFIWCNRKHRKQLLLKSIYRRIFHRKEYCQSN